MQHVSKASEAELSFYAETTNLLAQRNFLDVQINPVIGMVYSYKDNCWVTVSPFIQGEALCKCQVKDEFINRKLLDLGNELEQIAGVKGIKILKFNVKKSGDNFIITDICATVKALKKITSNPQKL